jgi:hypothetical protein
MPHLKLGHGSAAAPLPLVIHPGTAFSYDARVIQGFAPTGSIRNTSEALDGR